MYSSFGHLKETESEDGSYMRKTRYEMNAIDKRKRMMYDGRFKCQYGERRGCEFGKTIPSSLPEKHFGSVR